MSRALERKTRKKRKTRNKKGGAKFGPDDFEVGRHYHITQKQKLCRTVDPNTPRNERFSHHWKRTETCPNVVFPDVRGAVVYINHLGGYQWTDTPVTGRPTPPGALVIMLTRATTMRLGRDWIDGDGAHARRSNQHLKCIQRKGGEYMNIYYSNIRSVTDITPSRILLDSVLTRRGPAPEGKEEDGEEMASSFTNLLARRALTTPPSVATIRKEAFKKKARQELAKSDLRVLAKNRTQPPGVTYSIAPSASTLPSPPQDWLDKEKSDMTIQRRKQSAAAAEARATRFQQGGPGKRKTKKSTGGRKKRRKTKRRKTKRRKRRRRTRRRR